MLLGSCAFLSCTRAVGSFSMQLLERLLGPCIQVNSVFHHQKLKLIPLVSRVGSVQLSVIRRASVHSLKARIRRPFASPTPPMVPALRLTKTAQLLTTMTSTNACPLERPAPGSFRASRLQVNCFAASNRHYRVRSLSALYHQPRRCSGEEEE